MSFIEDDFYSSKASTKEWKEFTWGKGHRRRRGRMLWVAAGSMFSGALIVILAISLFGGFNSGGSYSAGDENARTAIVMDAQASFNDMVIHAAERVNPTVVSVINGQKTSAKDEAAGQNPNADSGDGRVEDNGSGDGSAGGDDSGGGSTEGGSDGSGNGFSDGVNDGSGAGEGSTSDGSAGEGGLQAVGMGSGVIFQKNKKTAYIITNNHVVEGADEVDIILASGEHKRAKVVGADSTTDLAVLEIDGKGITITAEFGDSDLLRAGETAIAIGNPLGLEFSQTITMGIISSPHRTVPVTLENNMEWEMDFIQTDAAINQGNSGGALVNLDGEVIGINSMKVSYMGVEGMGFAIPINEAKPIIDSLIQYGKVRRVFVGISHQDLQSFTQGTEVLNLPKGVTKGIVVLEAEGPALEAGLRGKDVIVEMDGHPIDSSLTMRKYLYTQKRIGDKVEIVFYRDGKKKRVILKLGEKE